MMLFALMIAALSGQETPYGAVGSRDLYAAPAIRPYEPPSSFGTQVAEGDADASVRTRPLTAPVAVEAYRHTYEGPPSRGEVSYEDGVNRARVAANAGMGSLDGVWHATGTGEAPVFDLVLSDQGTDRPIEGALSLRTAQGRQIGVVGTVTRENQTAALDAVVDGRTLHLSLQKTADGWAGTLRDAGRDQAVSLVAAP